MAATTKKRKPFNTAIHEEDEDAPNEVDEIDVGRPNKVLILNQNKCNRIAKFPCTIGEANELLMRQLVTVKFSFNPPLTRKKCGGSDDPVKDYNGNYDLLPLISADALRVPALIDSNHSEISEDRQTMLERDLELTELSGSRMAKQDQFDKSVQILYQKYEQRSTSHPMVGTMIVHQFITVAELSPTKGSYGKLCQICHTPLRSYSTIKCVHCDFKCHAHCQNRVSTCNIGCLINLELGGGWQKEILEV